MSSLNQQLIGVETPFPVAMAPGAGFALEAKQLPDNHQVAVSNFPVQQGVAITDGVNLDAFSRIRTSNPTQLFQSNMNYDLDPVDMEGGATGSGSVPVLDANVRVADLTVGAGNGTSFLQSYTHTQYQPGKSHLIFTTFTLGAGVADVVKEVGYFDASNGIFLRQNGTSGLEIVMRSSTSGGVVDTAIPQANWNVDALLGGGASGLTLDPTRAQILVIDLQFLGMGRVRIGFDLDGQIVVAHQFLNANNLLVPYMQTASLPVQALITNTSGGGPGATLRFKCCSVVSEGGFSNIPTMISCTPEGTVTAASGARTHILSIRPKLLFGGVVNRSNASIHSVSLLVTGSNPIFYEVCHGVTFSVAPTFADVNATYSAFEYGTGGTYSSLASGLVVDSGYLPATNQAKESASVEFQHYIPLTLDRAGAHRAMGTVSVLVTGIGGTSACRCSIHFDEYR